MRLREVIRTITEIIIKQSYCAMFGIYLLTLMLVSRYWYPFRNFYPYDFFFFAALVFQIFSLVSKIEEPKEVLVIMIFHAIAMVMELFKTSASIESWTYPQKFNFGIRTVPLFTGFMYSAVGSYLVRLMKVFNLRFSNYPKMGYTVFLVVIIYINFFLHHYFIDLRLGIYILTGLLFYKTKVIIKLHYRHMSTFLLVAWLVMAFLIWLAENIGSYLGVWQYPYQKEHWQMVGIEKIFAWFLLLMVSFVLVTLLYKPHNTHTK